MKWPYAITSSLQNLCFLLLFFFFNACYFMRLIKRAIQNFSLSSKLKEMSVCYGCFDFEDILIFYMRPCNANGEYYNLSSLYLHENKIFLYSSSITFYLPRTYRSHKRITFLFISRSTTHR